VLPQLARGDANKMWIIPSELTDALRGVSSALGGTPAATASGSAPVVPATRTGLHPTIERVQSTESIARPEGPEDTPGPTA